MERCGCKTCKRKELRKIKDTSKEKSKTDACLIFSKITFAIIES